MKPTELYPASDGKSYPAGTILPEGVFPLSPNPTPTGEPWTDIDLMRLMKEGGINAIIAGHNAALAAERKEIDDAYKEWNEMRDELAAEREKTADREMLQSAGYNNAGELLGKLAAERKGHEMDGQLISSQESEISQLREQLRQAQESLRLNALAQIESGKEEDALREQLEAAVEALTSIGKNTCCDRCQEAALVANAALAKLGKTK